MTELQARPARPDDLPAMLALWQQTPRADVLHHPAFAGEPPVGIVWERAGNLAGYLIVHARRRAGLTQWSTPLFAPHGGALWADAVPTDAADAERFWRDRLEALAHGLPRSVDEIDIIFPAEPTPDLRALQWSGWNVRPHWNLVSTWNDPGAWRADLESAVRRQERKARDAGLVVKHLPASDTAALEKLWRANAGHQGLDAAFAPRIGAIGGLLKQLDRGWVALVEDASGVAHAGALVGVDPDAARYLAGASDPALRGSGAPTLLHVGILEEIDRRGLARCYDWVGGNTPSVARFKRGFGPKLVLHLAAQRRSLKARVIRGLAALRG